MIYRKRFAQLVFSWYDVLIKPSSLCVATYFTIQSNNNHNLCHLNIVLFYWLGSFEKIMLADHSAEWMMMSLISGNKYNRMLSPKKKLGQPFTKVWHGSGWIYVLMRPQNEARVAN